MRIKNKIIAGVTAMSAIVANAASFGVEAATIPEVNSNFEYEMTAKKVSDAQIMITFFTTCNPGVSEISTALLYDNTKYKGVKVTNNFGVEDGYLFGSNTHNDEKGIFFVGGSYISNNNNNKEVDYSQDFEFNFYLEAKDGNATDEDLSKFSIAVVQYKSQAENINISHIHESYEDIAELELAITPSQSLVYSYILGDVNDSGGLELSDATSILSLNSAVQSTGVTPTINILNHLIYNNETSTYSNGSNISWGSAFGEFLRTVNNVIFPCVEVADADQNGIINTNDANTVLNWYSQIGASVITPSEILQVEHKTVYF